MATIITAAAAPSRRCRHEEELVVDCLELMMNRLMTQPLWPWTGLSCIYVQWLDDIYGQEGLFEATFQIYNRWNTFLNEKDLTATFCTNDSSLNDNSTWTLSSLGGVLCL
jgi:hypothetical protein